MNDRNLVQTTKLQGRRRREVMNQREDLAGRKKVANAAHSLMGRSHWTDEVVTYDQAEALVDAMVDLYSTIGGDWPSMRHGGAADDLARRLEHLEHAVRAYRKAFQET